MIGFYFFLYALFLLIAALLFPFNVKVRQGIHGRWKVNHRVKGFAERFSLPPVWIHVASSGEFEQCLPILDEIKNKSPETPIFITYFSPTARRAIELEGARRQRADRHCPWDGADFAPFDFPWTVRAFLESIKPKAFVAVHREVWPGILRACSRRGIPKLLVAAYFEQSPGLFLRRWLEQFDYIGVVDTESERRLSVLSFPLIECIGDSRVERVLQRRSLTGPTAWSEFFVGQKTVVLASIWPQDIAELESSLMGLMNAGGVRIILAPHEPHSDFVLSLEHFIRDHGGEVRRWSVWKESPDVSSHLVVDKVGELAEIYRVATLAFVGGSFKARVHNVLEPAAYAKPVLTGPYIENSAEAVEMCRQGALIKIEAGDQFQDRALELLRDDSLRTQISSRVADYIASHRGAHVAYATRILNSAQNAVFSAPAA